MASTTVEAEGDAIRTPMEFAVVDFEGILIGEWGPDEAAFEYPNFEGISILNPGLFKMVFGEEEEV